MPQSANVISTRLMSKLNLLCRNCFKRLPFSVYFYRILRDQLDRFQPLLVTPWGFLLAGNKKMASGSFEPVETSEMLKLLEEFDVFVNIGANIGYYCCHALHLGKSVVAFEPVARNLFYMLLNIKSNGWSDLAEVYPVALGDKTSIMPIWGGGTGASLIKGWAATPFNDVSMVPVHTLDRVLGDCGKGRRYIVLMDVEGAELAVLRGASKMLAHMPSPLWIVEISYDEHHPKSFNPNYFDTFELFFAAGYRAFELSPAREEITLSTLSLIAQGQRKPASHNYIFQRK